jgi:hypothetical protein
MIEEGKLHHGDTENTEKNKRIREFLLFFSVISVSPWCSFPSRASEPLPKFDRIVIDDNFPGGYQVEVADVNGDGKPDIVGVGGSTCAWYENPTWKKRIVTTGSQTPGIISSATTDLDGDGKAEVAIAYEFEMNQPKKGKLLLASQGTTLDDAWTLKPVADVPSIHRLRWGRFMQSKKTALLVAPLFGPDSKPPDYMGDSPDHYAVPRVYFFQADPKEGSSGSTTFPEAAAPILHAIDVLDVDGDGQSEYATASYLGAKFWDFKQDRFRQRAVFCGTSGAPGEFPKRGASEVHLGRLADGRRFVATIEPWHGPEVVICLAEGPKTFKLGPRTVIDDTLDDGHALWVADVDGDGDDEVFAGHRGKDFRVSAYDYDGKNWNKTVIDRGVAAQDLRGGDLDGDGTPDVVAIGGKTHNVVWYRPIRTK